jgi:hypothetical protein
VQRVLRPRRLSGVLTLKVDIAKTELNRSRLGDITATAQFLMDFQMPEMDGSKATQLIQALELKENRPYIPVIALTAGQRLKGSPRHEVGPVVVRMRSGKQSSCPESAPCMSMSWRFICASALMIGISSCITVH